MAEERTVYVEFLARMRCKVKLPADLRPDELERRLKREIVLVMPDEVNNPEFTGDVDICEAWADGERIA